MLIYFDSITSSTALCAFSESEVCFGELSLPEPKIPKATNPAAPQPKVDIYEMKG
ncbi:hypothetical protein K027_4501, partial [Acinetobacter baumannii 45057_1]